MPVRCAYSKAPRLIQTDSVDSLHAHQPDVTVLRPVRTAATPRPVPMLPALVLAKALRAQIRACHSTPNTK